MMDHDAELNRAEANLEMVINNQTDNIVIQQLSKLSPIELDRQLPKLAKQLNIKKSTLENEVKKISNENNKNKDDDNLFVEHEPWPYPVDGAILLNNISSILSKYIVLPKYTVEAVALWIMNTYCQDITRISPLLTITSPEKRCGKTTLLSLLMKLVYKALPASNISYSAVFRSMELWQPTLIIDEADSFFSGNDELRGIINSGHTRDTAFVIRTVGDEFKPKRFSTWGAKAIASIGILAPTIMDRSIVINLRRKKITENTQLLRLDKLNTDEIIRKCLRWKNDNSNNIKNSDPHISNELHDRAKDNWRPLFAIADLAGGDWPIKSRNSAKALTPIENDDDAAGILLLRDIKKEFEVDERDRITSIALVGILIEMDERPWPEYKNGKSITPKQIASLLKPFGIKPNVTRIGNTLARGYLKNDFIDAFARYLPETSVTT